MCGTKCLFPELLQYSLAPPFSPDAMLDNSSASLSLRTTLHGERGRKVGFGPKNVCFHVKNWSMVEAVHSASLSHIILARIVGFYATYTQKFAFTRPLVTLSQTLLRIAFLDIETAMNTTCVWTCSKTGFINRFVSCSTSCKSRSKNGTGLGQTRDWLIACSWRKSQRSWTNWNITSRQQKLQEEEVKSPADEDRFTAWYNLRNPVNFKAGSSSWCLLLCAVQEVFKVLSRPWFGGWGIIIHFGWLSIWRTGLVVNPLLDQSWFLDVCPHIPLLELQ